MKFFIKKIYIVLFLLNILLINSEVFAKNSKTEYTRENISNYFLGIISSNHNYNNDALKYLQKVQSIKNEHTQFNIEFLRTLVLLEKFDQAFSFSKSIWAKNEFLFEVDLLLGLESFINKDYINAKKHFKRLNKISQYNLFFDEFIGNILIAWMEASEGKKEASFKFLEKVSKPYHHLTKIQKSFLECYFDMDNTQVSFEELTQNQDYDFSRYNFFLTNYFLSKDNTGEAKKTIMRSSKKYNSNLLIKHTEKSLLNNKNKKIKNFFNCQNSRDTLAEFFYILANLYSSEKEYQTSNFYLKISLVTL